MYWKDTAELVTITETPDDEGYKEQAEARRTVFVNKKSATRSEFYKAKQAGDEIVLVLEVRGVDYNGETRLYFGGDPFEVVRAYTVSGDKFELNCKEAAITAETESGGEEAGT